MYVSLPKKNSRPGAQLSKTSGTPLKTLNEEEGGGGINRISPITMKTKFQGRYDQLLLRTSFIFPYIICFD